MLQGVQYIFLKFDYVFKIEKISADSFNDAAYTECFFFKVVHLYNFFIFSDSEKKTKLGMLVGIWHKSRLIRIQLVSVTFCFTGNVYIWFLNGTLGIFYTVRSNKNGISDGYEMNIDDISHINLHIK